MRYEILYGSAFPVVQCDLEQGEMVQAESDAMVSKIGRASCRERV